MTLTMPLAKATLVPGLSLRWMSACAASLMSRGSTTMSLQPRSTAARTCMPSTGWASSGLEPTSRMQSALPVMSSMVFVIAPEPSVVARPATVGACQTRAQLSTLFVSNAHLAIFWSM